MPDDSRYEEILRRIQQRKAQEAVQQQQDALGVVLDAVNALGVLEAVKKKPPAALNAYGPRVFSKVQHFKYKAQSISPQSLSEGDYWTGAVLWYKPKGYGQYETLGLLGIWAVQGASEIELIVGTKQLAFSAPLFNPESYYRHLLSDFSVYYAGEPSPPDEQLLYQIHYQPEQRLAIRTAIEDAVQRWGEAQR